MYLAELLAFQGALLAPGGTGHTMLRRRLVVDAMFCAVATRAVGYRPDRLEPSATKRRPKPQDLLTECRKHARNRFMPAR